MIATIALKTFGCGQMHDASVDAILRWLSFGFTYRNRKACACKVVCRMEIGTNSRQALDRINVPAIPHLLQVTSCPPV